MLTCWSFLIRFNTPTSQHVNTPTLQHLITFHTEDIQFQLDNTEKTQQWILQTIESERATLSFINFIFCSDTYLHRINLEYLNHDTYTDIITFPYSDKTIESDIFISIERVRENAQKFDTTFTHELHRVIIHGVLHLLGYHDKTPEQQQQMKNKEDFWLERITP